MDRKPLIYQFDDVSVDLEKFEVIKADRRAHLEPKAFEVLVFLIEHRGRLVEKKELLDAVWKDAFVGENAMTRVIAQLRKALGDDTKDAKYIETVPTRGYRFIPEVEINQRPGSNGVEAARLEQAPGESGLAQAMLSGEQSSVAAVAPPNAAATPTPSVAVLPSIGGYLISEIKRHKTGAMLMLSALILVVATSVYFYLTRGSHDAIDSIAVLPLANASGDPDTEYLSDGLTESLINSLSQLSTLRVVARSTVFRYKGKETDSPKVGRELGVRAVLSGRVLQRGETLTIQAELVDVTNGSQLWGEQYDRRLSDLLTIKQEIAREITEKLRLRLSGEEQRQLAKRDTGNTDAYQFYLKGRYHFNKRPAEGFKKAIGYFQHALDIDPNYALAYAGLADCYSWLELLEGTPASETYPIAKAYAERALQIDETLAEAHTSLGTINDRLWQFGEAEKEFRRAIILNPNDPTAHDRYSLHLIILRRLDAAMAELKRAQELDPRLPTSSWMNAWVYLLTGDLGAAIEQARMTIELDPNDSNSQWLLGLAYLRQRRDTEAIAQLQKAFDLSGSRVDRSFLGYGYAISGKRTEALAIAKELEKGEASGVRIAVVYAGLGDNDQAFAWLEKAFQTHSGDLIVLPTNLGLDSLRSDPRYADLLRRIGFPQ